MARYPLSLPTHFPHVTYRRGAAGQPVPVLRGTGIRVQTVVVAAHLWGLTPAKIATEYGLAKAQVNDALAFYDAHRAEIDAAIAADQTMDVVWPDRGPGPPAFGDTSI